MPRAAREIDAEGRVVTPGFVDVHTHLDAQLGWDPLPTSSCWHGITSVVLGNCGVTFAPVGPGRARVPRRDDGERRGHPPPGDPRGPAVGLDDVRRLPRLARPHAEGHQRRRARRPLRAARRRRWASGRWSRARARPRTSPGCARWPRRRWRPGPSGISTSRTLGHVVPDGRPVPGTWAGPDELLAFGDVLGRAGTGLFEGAMRLGERDDEALTKTRAEVARDGRDQPPLGPAGELRPGPVEPPARPVRPGHRLHQGARTPTVALVRPQTTARGIGILFGLFNRTPWDRTPAFRELHDLPPAERARRDPRPAVAGPPDRRRRRGPADARAAT